MKEIMEEHNAQRAEVLAAASGAKEKKRSGSPVMKKSITNRILEGIDNKGSKKQGLGKSVTFNPMSRKKLDFKRIGPVSKEDGSAARGTADALGEAAVNKDFNDNLADGTELMKKTTKMIDDSIRKANTKKQDDKKDEGKLIEKSEE